MKYTVTVLGLGFVGLTTALAFAEKSHKVYAVDINEKRMNQIKNGEIPFHEPGLEDALNRHNNKNFIVSNNVTASVRDSDFVFLCVGTPAKSNGEADLSYIFAAIDMFADILLDGKYRVVVCKSTIPPSTTLERIIPYFENKNIPPGDLFSVANNPEFLREGKCWDDMMNADRIVCGIAEAKAEEMLRALYSSFPCPFFPVSLNTSEFIKYLSNTLLATMISFANEMSRVADVIGNIEMKEAFDILHLDKRWGGGNMASYVYPGPGYGGYCLPKDTKALYFQALSKGYEPKMIRDVIEINNFMPMFWVDKVMKCANSSDKIGILGLSFKPGTDDVRDSISAKMIHLLKEKGYENLLAFDPQANEAFANEFKIEGLTYFDSLQEICEQSDILMIVTAWDDFLEIDQNHLDKQIIDCRYILSCSNR